MRSAISTVVPHSRIQVVSTTEKDSIHSIISNSIRSMSTKLVAGDLASRRSAMTNTLVEVVARTVEVGGTVGSINPTAEGEHLHSVHLNIQRQKEGANTNNNINGNLSNGPPKLQQIHGQRSTRRHPNPSDMKNTVNRRRHHRAQLSNETRTTHARAATTTKTAISNELHHVATLIASGATAAATKSVPTISNNHPGNNIGSNHRPTGGIPPPQHRRGIPMSAPIEMIDNPAGTIMTVGLDALTLANISTSNMTEGVEQHSMVTAVEVSACSSRYQH